MAKYNQFYAILSSLKRTFSRSPVHREVLKKAKCPRKKGPRGGARYRCEVCRKDFGIKEVNVDHKDPVIPIGRLARELSWDEIVERLFCEPDNLQCVCKKCHDKKSKEENLERKKAKDENSNSV